MHLVCRKDIHGETGIDPSTIKDYEDMTAVYAKVKELHPDMVCLGGSGTATPAGQDCSFDGLAGFNAGLMDYGQTTTVTSWTESERFDPSYKTCKRMVFRWIYFQRYGNNNRFR